jgi:LacI family transcriptional regulator
MKDSVVTIKDIAKYANVSVSTVSRVVNGLNRVSDETRNNVLKAIKKYNYTPNRFAASMITKKTNMIAIVVPSITNPFYTAVIQGALKILKDAGYFACVFSADESMEEEELFFKNGGPQNMDGVISVAINTDPEFYRNIKKPLVLVGRYVDGSGQDGIVIDKMKGAYDAAKNLLDNGHKKIAIVLGHRTYNDGKERYWGFYNAIRDYGLDIDPAYIQYGDWIEEHGYKATFKLMGLQTPPTAIFAANNLICIGVIKALRDLNLTIGDSVSLVGFGDNELADYTIPKVTVVNRPTYEMGVQAAKILIQKIHNDDHSSKKLVLETELLIRGSVKDIRGREDLS